MALSRAMAHEGVRATFAVNDLSNLHLVSQPGEITTLQSPVWPGHRHWGHRPDAAGYADILAGVGFADPAKLSAMISAWDGLLALLQPDLVVADHSPALLAALWGSPVPVISVGTPFTMPPLSLGRMPPLRADQASMLPEQRLYQSLLTSLSGRPVRPPARLVDLFRTDERLVFGLPELDPYRPCRDEPILAPPEPMPAYADMPLRPHLFVYAGSEVPQLTSVVEALAGLDVTITAYLRGDVGPLPHFLKRRGHIVHDTPPPLDAVLPTASHVLSQGGAFTCQAALSAGRPHLIMPLHNETRLNLSMCSQLGVARRLDLAGDEIAVRTRISTFLSDTDLIRNAKHWALTLANRPGASGLDAALAALRRHVGAGAQARSARLRSAAATAQPS